MLLKLLPVLLTASSVLSAPTHDLQDRAAAAAVTPHGGQVVVDGGGVYMRSTRVKDGSILGGYAASEGANRVLRVTKSTNNGDSWSVIGTVASGDGQTHDMDNADIVQLPSGRILYAFRNHDQTGPGNPTYFRITICYSDDGGATWRFLSQLDERPRNGKNGLWEPFMRVSRNGTLQAFYSSENNPGDQDNLLKTSTDGGKTWNGPFPVSGGGVNARDGMTGVTNIDNNGNLICVFETTENGRFTIKSVFSHDDGFTWGERREVYNAPNNRNAGAPQVINVGGRLVASFMEKQETNIDGGEMKVVVSTDGGRGWSAPTVTGGQGSHWPGLQTISNNEFLALYAFNGKGQVSQKYGL